jgi:predicted porin
VTSIGAAYDLGIAKLFANKISSTVSGSDTGETNVGVKMPMGAATLYAGWGRNTGTSSVSSSDYVVGADYTMSKRTNAYARMNKRQLVDAGAITNAFSVGLRHQF